MSIRTEAFDFSAMMQALNVEALGEKLFNSMVDQMTVDTGRLAISVDLKPANQDSSVTGMGDSIDLMS